MQIMQGRAAWVQQLRYSSKRAKISAKSEASRFSYLSARSIAYFIYRGTKMNAKLVLAVGSATALLASTAAIADIQAGSTYVGGQIAQANYDVSGAPDFEPTVIVARIGHFFVDNFAVEARLGTGLSDDTNRIFGTNVSVEIDYVFGVYGVGYLPLGDTPLSLYGLAGFTRGKATASALGVSESESDSDFSFGVGLQANFTPQVTGHVEYMSYLDKSDYDVTALGVGINFHF